MADNRLRVRCACGRVFILPPGTAPNEAGYVDCDWCCYGADMDLLIKDRMMERAGASQAEIARATRDALEQRSRRG